MKTYKEAHHRTILKTISWRIIATCTTMTIVYFFTGQVALSLGVGVVEVITKMIFYYLHERAWSLSHLGRKEHPLSSLPVEKPLDKKDMQEVRKKLIELGYISEE